MNRAHPKELFLNKVNAVLKSSSDDSIQCETTFSVLKSLLPYQKTILIKDIAFLEIDKKLNNI
jgi:hypothetical protein